MATGERGLTGAGVQIPDVDIVISITLYVLMDSSFWTGTLYNVRGYRLQFPNKIVVFSLKIVLVLAKSVEPD